jgi:hypothetical protein
MYLPGQRRELGVERAHRAHDLTSAAKPPAGLDRDDKKQPHCGGSVFAQSN